MCLGSFPLNYCVKENKMSNLLIYCKFRASQSYVKLLQLVTDQNEIQFTIHFYASCLDCSLSNQLLKNGEQLTRSYYLEVQNAGTLTAFPKGVVTWSCESFNSIQ